MKSGIVLLVLSATKFSTLFSFFYIFRVVGGNRWAQGGQMGVGRQNKTMCAGAAMKPAAA